MSRLSNRLSSIAAVFAIALLVIFIVIMWSDFESKNNKKNDNINTSSAYKQSRLINVNQNINNYNTPDIINISPSQENDVSSDSFDEKKWDPRDDLFPNNNGDIEYVKPIKISQNQYEDPPTKDNNARRHHTGHFRHSSAEVWDPHPQYEFTAFGKHFRLILAHDTSFVSQDVKVTHMSKNKTKWEHPGHQLGCYYSGVVDGDPKSDVSVSLCHGMMGHVKTSTGSYMIKPVENWKNDKNITDHGTSLEHAIYRVSTNRTTTNDVNFPSNTNHNCGVIDYDTVEEEAPSPLIDDTSAAHIYVGDHKRERRSLTEKAYIDDSIEDDTVPVLGEFLRDDDQTYYPDHSSWNDRRYERKMIKEIIDKDDGMTSDELSSWRLRRALPREYFIEITVVADAKMMEYHGDGLIGYILVLMSTVSRIYKDPSIGNPISIAVTRIVPTDEIFGTKHENSDGMSASEMLKQFCIWQKRHNPDEPSSDHHDAALLLTRENLCHNPGQDKCDTLGLAELGRMCSPGSSCAIVQDNGLASAFTIAHEIGHVLNMPHDDDSKCVKFQNLSGVLNVMSRMLDANTFPWEWSKCSRHHVTEFLEAGYGNCLLDQPSNRIKSSFGRLPGEDYSEDQQCELVNGPGSQICPQKEIVGKDLCKRLWCIVPPRNECHTQHMPWADGTPCSNGKWCNRGECVSRKNLQPIDGQWGKWGRYGDCSRTCGGGIKKKYRECDNPSPKNGGNYCIGDRVKYRSCATNECPHGSPDFRQEQCSQFNNNNLKIQGLARDVKWIAKYMKIPEDRCKLYCQVKSNQYYMLLEKVIDGTPCGLDTFHICVNGQCKHAGCDHTLNSTAELDSCGVCRGDNSTCQRITGSYNSSGVYGYRRITKIPAGSSFIDIRQHGWNGMHNDSNYLALRLGEYGQYILNGNYMVMYKKVIVLPGIVIEYSGSKGAVEILNSSRPIGVDLILEVLSVGDNIVPPQITYEYTVPKKILDSYTWILSDWSSCSHMCQGVMQRRAECRSTEHKDVVSDDYCQHEQRPDEHTRSCNTDCILKWHLASKTECSNHCGSGIQTSTFHCGQISNKTFWKLPPHACSHLDRPKETEPCIGPCDNAHWSYNDWDTCSVTCGGGIQTRTAKCIDSNNRVVSDNNCKTPSILKRLCGQDACPKWAFDNWSPCSVSCGIGKRVRPYWCQVDNQVVNTAYCSSPISNVAEPCNAGPCHRWSTGEWSSCSVTCGEGTRRRKVACLNADGTIGDACAASEIPDDIETCALDPCPTVASLPPVIYSSGPPHDEQSEHENEVDNNAITFQSGYDWRIGSFSECSKSCSGGYKKRVVQCTEKETHIGVRDDYCDAHRRPASTLSCNRHACPVWNTGEWSQCNVECGEGFQYRQVRCQRPDGEVLSNSDCANIEKPKHAKKCRKVACTNSKPIRTDEKKYLSRKWRISNWTPCSKSCGGGIKTRKIECMMRLGSNDELVDDVECLRAGLTRPKSQRPCQRVLCDYSWQESSWSECSVDCGEGIQRRTITCHRVNRFGWIDPTPTDGCSIIEKPENEQSCKLRECNDKYYWTAGTWRKCSHQCGRKGRQIRRLFCHDRKGKKVARSNCPVTLKPQRKRKCNQRRCRPLTCLEAKKRNSKDGEYTLLIGGRNMSIYCHNMMTNEPKEYLTLPAGDRENYAEIYNKRLLNPHSCPHDGQRNDSCNCVSEHGAISGRTMYKRVRIDVEKLIILANDYTFSRTDGAKRVEYGKAGDCYSSADCPQGRFSINLGGTYLKLSSKVNWIPQKSRAHLAIDRINDQRILGRCGGYCGFCTPNMDLKLNVLPS